ncbi:reverse transcriptase domain-containing protein [Tanacetum coccineum]
MSNHEPPTPSHPKSDVRNTVGKEKQTPQGSARTTSAVDLEEFYKKHYEKLLPIMADKYEYERRKKEKLEEVKARLDFGEARKKRTKALESAYSESRTMSPKRQRRSRSPGHSPSVFTRLRRERSRSPRHDHKSKPRRESTVFKRLGSRGRSAFAHSDSRQESSRYTENHSESEDSEGGHWKSKSRRQKSSVEDDDLSQPWAAAKMERWAMPTWCHMFNSTLTGNARVWFDDLPPESIDSYNDLREAFLKNYLQQKKCIRDHIVLHNIKQRDGESTEDFIQRYKSESENVKGAPKCMRISEFVHGITNPELIKRFIEKIPKTVDEMMQKRETSSDSNDPIMAKDSEAKDIPTLSPNLKISFPSLGDDEGAEGPLIIEAEIEGYQVHRMQKKRGQGAERNIAINDEVSKLVAAGIMREVHYHDWLSNPVMVKKHDDSWRMCVDFKDLNKACPKDGSPRQAVSVVLMRKEKQENAISTLPRVFVKGQVLADFIMERPEEEGQDDSTKEEEPLPAQFADSGKNGRLKSPSNVDSKLVANQVNGTYIAKETDMIKYLEKVKTLASTFRAFSIKQVPRSKNKKADALSKIASTSFAHLSKQGSCSMHAGTRSVVAKALRIGYYWPTMHKDARALIKACQECQVHKPVLRNPQEKLNPITSSWPFYKWGIDIAGPFPEGPLKVKFLIVAMDYFTKWIEAKPVATITGNQVKKFVWENIVCRFGLSGEIISDNGKQFRDNPFKDWCEKLCWEKTTRTGWKKSLMSFGHTEPWCNGDTPFSLTYGMEAVIPAEIGMPTFRTVEVNVAKNDKALEINLELLEEKREQAAIREAKSKRQMEKYYDAKVRNTSFKPGDLVYRNNEASHTEDTRKLGPKWEGPYEVTKALGKGSYRLKNRNGKELPRTWNVCNLKKCYIHKM